jgi:ribosome maturation factor RimP
MATEEKVQEIIKLVEQLLEAEPTYFIIGVNVRPVNNISLFIDGDAGVTIEKCVRINKALYKQIVENEVYADGEFSLEVSSPGIDEPLKMTRQYIKNIGREIEVDTADDRHIEGKLIAADFAGIELDEETGKGKKKETIKHFLLFEQIKETKVKVVF